MTFFKLLLLHLLSANHFTASSENFAIFRSSCRHDALFKRTDVDKRVTGTESITPVAASSLSSCMRSCLQMTRCLSLNYNTRQTAIGTKNCELITIKKSDGNALIVSAAGWNHYEPQVQESPRCRLVTCSAGYACYDTCSSLSGYECRDIDECSSSPCKNDGVCINQVNKYSCTCAAGYTGTNCETNIDECSSSPCKNGGVCTDHVNKYSCTCAAGYTGTNCETNINECSSSPCKNGGACTDHVNKYSCSCAAGYTGTNCEITKITKRFTNEGRIGRIGVIQQFTIPYAGNFRIQAGGARGGKHVTNYGTYPGTFYGGYGATMQGVFSFPAGLVLNIVVGHRGGDSVEVKGGQATTATAASLGLSIEDNAGTGGGGGSFVYSTGNVLYIAAGGGGGATAGWNGVNGQSGTSGAAAVGTSSTLGAGGTSGYAGQCCSSGSYHGGAGAGWHSIAYGRAGWAHGERGYGLAQSWEGGRAGGMNSGTHGGPAPGAVGGFGGGGGGAEDNGASGGGGGYSGGGSGGYSNAAGGGGGSFCGGSSCSGVTGGNTGSDNGFVTISGV